MGVSSCGIRAEACVPVGYGIIYMVFVDDRTIGQVDLRVWMIEDMPLGLLEFVVFYTNELTGRNGLDNNSRGISEWLRLFFLTRIYARPTGVQFDQIELLSSCNHDLFIMRRDKSGAGIFVDLWLERENSWGNPVRLTAPAPDSEEYIVSFCLRLESARPWVGEAWKAAVMKRMPGFCFIWHWSRVHCMLSCSLHPRGFTKKQLVVEDEQWHLYV